MFEISGDVKESYCEVHQTNGLRWTMLFRTGAKTFERQTSAIKCKDFFNDTLAFFKAGSVFNMYGYKSSKKKNNEGVYFLLTNVVELPTFRSNIEVLNSKLKEQLGEVLEVLPQTDDSVILLIPNACWESTWRLSLVTMMIRCCNYGVKYQSWDDFYRTDAPMNHQEHAFTQDAKTNTQKWGFVVPEAFSKFWWFCGEGSNSEKNPKQTGGTIHNNGCSNWSMFMKMEGVAA